MKSNSFNFKNKNKQNNENYLSNNTVSSNLNQNNMNNDYLNHENSNIHSQLINSLKEKIKVYEKDIENLIEEKLAMQIEINNYQIKKNQINANIMNNSENIDKIIELNNQLNQQNFSMKNEINKGGFVGRKLDFVAQEMNREANTTLSKSSDINITNTGIELRTLIEKIREQIQNIE